MQLGVADNELVVVRKLTKIYSNNKVAVDDLSLCLSDSSLACSASMAPARPPPWPSSWPSPPPTSSNTNLVEYNITHRPNHTQQQTGYCL